MQPCPKPPFVTDHKHTHKYIRTYTRIRVLVALICAVLPFGLRPPFGCRLCLVVFLHPRHRHRRTNSLFAQKNLRAHFIRHVVRLYAHATYGSYVCVFPYSQTFDIILRQRARACRPFETYAGRRTLAPQSGFSYECVWVCVVHWAETVFRWLPPVRTWTRTGFTASTRHKTDVKSDFNAVRDFFSAPPNARQDICASELFGSVCRVRLNWPVWSDLFFCPHVVSGIQMSPACRRKTNQPNRPGVFTCPNVSL